MFPDLLTKSENWSGLWALTHWDNFNGFGMVGVKHALQDTPGAQFGRKNVKYRYVR